MFRKPLYSARMERPSLVVSRNRCGHKCECSLVRRVLQPFPRIVLHLPPMRPHPRDRSLTTGNAALLRRSGACIGRPSLAPWRCDGAICATSFAAFSAVSERLLLQYFSAVCARGVVRMHLSWAVLCSSAAVATLWRCFSRTDTIICGVKGIVHRHLQHHRIYI